MIFDDLRPSLARDVADHMLELHIHLGQRFLHVLDMVGRVLHQHGALAQVAPQPSYLRPGPEGSRQQSVGVQLLQPLAVQHVSLPTGHVLDAPRVHQHHLKSPLFQHPEQRYPVHPGGFHHHGLHSALRQPLRQAVQVRRVGRELPHRLLRTVLGHRHKVTAGPHVDSRCVQVYLGQLRRQSLPAVSGPSNRLHAPLACAHDPLHHYGVSASSGRSQ